MGLLRKIGAGLGAVFAPTTLLGTALAGGGSALDYFSAQQQNRSAETMAKDATAASALQAREQMAFQERMSSTAHEREVIDLRKAGLNPLLSLNSGASSPAGAMGTTSVAPVVPELSHIMSGARDSIGFMADMRAKKATIDLTDAHKANVNADTRLKRGNIPAAEGRGDFIKWLRQLMSSRKADFGSAVDSMRKQSKEKGDHRGWRTLEVQNAEENYLRGR